MTPKRWVTVAAAMLLAASWAGTEEIAGLPLHVQRLAPGAIRVWLGDHISSTAIVAFATEKGVVVVDTFGIPQVDTGLRAVIARELGRSDFALLVNTHEHADHTGGNVVYADCPIVGHELVEAGMAGAAAQRDRLLEWYPNRIAELEQELAGVSAGSPEAARLSEDLILSRLLFTTVEAGRTPVPPTVTFSDRMTLDMGDTTFALSFIGGMHSASDTAVLVPEHGLLLTGDTMADVWLTDTPGCLAAFTARPGIPHDFPRLLANWDLLLAEKERITTLLPAHWNGELSMAGAEARVEYVRALWNGINRAAAEGTSLADVQAAYRLDTRFPELVESRGFSARENATTIQEMWTEVTGEASAARTLFQLIDEGAAEPALREVLAERGRQPSKYYFNENEINAYGYAFLQQDRVEQAIALFKLNVELFPESWNVYDSLGEALLRAGDATAAKAMYEKSLALNPDNTSGRDALAKIHGETAATR